MTVTQIVAPAADTKRVDARTARYVALAEVRRITSLRARNRDGSTKVDADGRPLPGRTQLCRRALSDLSAGVGFRVTMTADGPRGGVSGLQTCGSVWACPVCSEKINAARQAELQAGIERWRAAGHGVALVTATLQHNKGHRLAELWDAISPAWNRTTSGAGVAWNGSKKAGGDIGDKARYGIAGIVRLVETKHGENGWHPHVHALIFTEKPLNDDDALRLRSSMSSRWQTAIVKAGYKVRHDSVGFDLRLVTNVNGIADYFAKNTYGITPSGAAYEVTGSSSKRLGKGGLSPFQVLERMVTTGDCDDLDLWHEWEKASFRRRQLTWTHGLRDLLALGEEATDDELAEAELDADAILVTLTEDEWKAGRWWDHLGLLLSAAEGGTLGEWFPWVPPQRWQAMPTRLVA